MAVNAEQSKNNTQAPINEEALQNIIDLIELMTSIDVNAKDAELNRIGFLNKKGKIIQY